VLQQQWMHREVRKMLAKTLDFQQDTHKVLAKETITCTL